MQIDLINPDIVLCCNTQEIGYDIIYSDVAFERISPSIETCNCWKFGERLVIEFYHPSLIGFRLSSEELYNVLCDMVMGGNVFEKFSWGKKYN